MDALTAIAARAAQAILRLPQRRGVRIKADGSPVTAADEAAEAIIRDGLARLAPACRSSRRSRPRASSRAVAGGELFPGRSARRHPRIHRRPRRIHGQYRAGDRRRAAPRHHRGAGARPDLARHRRPRRRAARICVRGRELAAGADPHPRRGPHGELVVDGQPLASRSAHQGLSRRPAARAKHLPCGSSIKFCRLAEGAADLYPRLAPTHEWDIAAGHAILAAAGGSVLAPDGAAARLRHRRTF